MQYLPDALSHIPINISFVPIHGCVHFCSFCAENSGKKIEIVPFNQIRTSILSYPYAFNRVALYNACDSLMYRWRSGKKVYTILDIVELFKQKGCTEFLISSPGIWQDDINKVILDHLASDNTITIMLSFNRDHLLQTQRMNNFYWTAKNILKHRTITVRLVYCSPGEKEVLVSELNRMFGKEILFCGLLQNGIVLETVPALPLGRAKALFFKNAHGNRQWMRTVEDMILKMFREERTIREVRFIAEGNYIDFLQHAAVQFSGMFIFLFVPTPTGGEVILKVTDVEKIKRTSGSAIATCFRYNPNIKKFIHIDASGKTTQLHCLVVDSNSVMLSDFIKFIENDIAPEEKRSIAKLFAAMMASNIFSEKCQLNDSMRMFFLNKEYVLYYRKASEAIMSIHNFSSLRIRRFFPILMSYLHNKGNVI